jgi:3-oxoacyl-[acyl-carrier-protein] synthase II
MTQFAVQTIRRALEQAGRAASDPGVRLVLATSLAGYLDDDASRPSLSAWANDVARELGMATPPLVVSTACSSGSDAIMAGAELIRAGLATCCICGGVDVITLSKRLAHSALGTMSPTQLRAFDVRHDGTLIGEGAGIIVMDSAPGDRKPLAYFRGAGAANDATGMTMADITGLSAAYAIRRSLADAQLSAPDIGLINAHGSGTQMNDATESHALATVFSHDKKPLVFATKGNFGQTLGATGTIEAIALILALRSGHAPPIAALEQPDAQFTLPLAMTRPTPCDARIGLSLTLGFGGFDTALIFEAAP